MINDKLNKTFLVQILFFVVIFIILKFFYIEKYTVFNQSRCRWRKEQRLRSNVDGWKFQLLDFWIFYKTCLSNVFTFQHL